MAPYISSRRLRVGMFVVASVLVALRSGTLVTSWAVNGAGVCFAAGGADCEEWMDLSNGGPAESFWMLFPGMQPAEAIAVLRQTLLRRPEHSVARLRLAEILWSLAETSSATKELEPVPPALRYFFRELASSARLNDSSSAEKVAAMAEQAFPYIVPANYGVYVSMCDLARRKLSQAEAVKWCERAVAATGYRSVWDLIFLAQTYEGAGRLESALEVLERAAGLDHSAGNSSVLAVKGHIESRLGDLDAALESLRDSLGLDKANPYAHLWIADVYLQRQDTLRFCSHRRHAAEGGLDHATSDWAWRRYCRKTIPEG